MDTVEKARREKKPNVGENIRLLRRLRGFNQRDLSEKMHVTQQTLSEIENSEEVSDEQLEKVAEALGIPAEVIRDYNHEDTINFIITNNEISGQGSSIDINNQHETNITNPLDKVTELYERLLSEQKERYEQLKKQLDDVTSELIELKNRK